MSRYGHRTGNWKDAIINKMGGEEAADRFLRGELAVVPTEREFKVWKTLLLGGERDLLLEAFERERHIMDQYALNMIREQVVLSAETSELDLVKTTVGELGFWEDASYAEIRARVEEFGLKLCPDETGFHLKRQYQKQPLGEYLIVVSEPVSCYGMEKLFRVSYVGDSPLLSCRALGTRPVEAKFRPSSKLVLAKPRS